MHKSLSFITLIAIGIFLKIKIKGAPARDGIKTLILALALPATIFVALMKIQLSGSLFALPLLGLLINILLLLAATYFIIPIFAREESEAKRRTFKLILPSLAPGLSCFPFIVEYLGEGSLANAALMDVGNKIFVLIVLYLLAMRWYYQIQSVNDNTAKKRNTGQRIKELLTTLIREPVNAVIVLALILLSLDNG